MNKRNGTGAWRALWLLLWLVAPLAHAATPVEDYTRWPFIDRIAVSPSGTKLAMAVPTVDGRVHLAVMSLAPLGTPKAIAGFDNVDVARVQWVNDERLVFDVTDLRAAYEESGSGLYAINHDGSGLRLLIAFQVGNDETSSTIASRVLPWEWQLHSTVDDGSPDVIVVQRRFDSQRSLRALVPARLDTVTGERHVLALGAPPGARQWLFDRQGVARAVVTGEDNRRALHWRKAADAPWQQVAEWPRFDASGFDPLMLDAQGGLLVLGARGRDTEALYRFDPETRTVDKDPLVALQGFDLDPAIVTDSATHEILGLHFRMEQGGSYWFDPALRKVQQGVDAALPAGRVNRLHCGRCKSSRFLVVASSSDRQPGEFYLFDREKASLERIASARPWIAEATQGRRSFQRMAARDGLMLPVYVTRPADAPAGKPLPAVLLVHGGPWVRGHDLGWASEAQFLASRGYLVIETEYRGSIGYGMALFKAGFRQWGEAMQDDLADAALWAVKQGLADPKRIAIVGGSYGGYAALMGPIRHPDLYRAAVSYAGVSDIELMYDIHWSDFSDAYKQYGMPLLIGDREKDAARLAAASPLRQVARLKVPVLLAHGGLDRRVPIDHSRRFRAAAEAAGVKVEWIEYADEGHGWRSPAHRADFWKRVEAFLGRTIGAAAP
jgi:dipeptidyl aminopeptidase/acylaminoacyl peptidase